MGQLLNLSELANACGVSAPTIQRWLSIFEASYIIFLLQPYANNFNKRVIHHPKIYFYDTGIICNLLDIESPERLSIDRLRGHIFENFVIADLRKQYFNKGKQPPLYFWRDKNGTIEVDCIIENSRTLFPIEVKSAETISLDFFTHLKKWNALANAALIPIGKSYIIYGSEKSQEWEDWAAIGWRDMARFINQLNILNQPFFYHKPLQKGNGIIYKTTLSTPLICRYLNKKHSESIYQKKISSFVL